MVYLGNKRSHVFTCVFCCCLVLSIVLGCATAGPAKSKRPDWLIGSSADYPPGRYLVGVGYGPERQVAEDNARAEISKVFVARIQQRSYEFEQYLQIAAKGRTESTHTVDLQQVTSVGTEKILSGIKVVDYYKDKSSKPPTHYALAVLDRIQAQNSLGEKIDQLDGEILNLVTESESASDMLLKLKSLKSAIGKMVLREAYNEELRVVNPSGFGKKSRFSLGDLKSKLAFILKDQFNLAIEVSGPYHTQITQALTEALTHLGFVINPDPYQATVLIRGDVSLTPADLPHPKWKFMRWSVDFQLIDRRDGKIFGSVNPTGKEGHLTLAEAEKKAVRSMQRALNEQVGQQVSDYIFGQ